jgi:mycofactocin precursor
LHTDHIRQTPEERSVTERIPESTAIVATIAPAADAAPEAATPLKEASPTTPLVESELLVEDVSIDGMCGVY